MQNYVPQQKNKNKKKGKRKAHANQGRVQKLPSGQSARASSYLKLLARGERQRSFNGRCHQKQKTMTYSSSIAASRRGYVRRNQNSVSFASSARSLGPVSNTIILIILACLIGLLYLTQVTKTNSFGYTINNLEKQQSQLQDQKANLEVTAARLQSLDRVSSSDTAKNLVSVAPSGVVQ